jgi:hypothetical protein
MRWKRAAQFAIAIPWLALAADPQGPKQATSAEKELAAKRSAVRVARQSLAAAASSCIRPEDCDPKSPGRNPETIRMIESAERSFIVACGECAPEDVCERVKQRIRDGSMRAGEDLCAPKPGAAPGAAKPSATPAGAKPATGGGTK